LSAVTTTVFIGRGALAETSMDSGEMLARLAIGGFVPGEGEGFTKRHEKELTVTVTIFVVTWPLRSVALAVTASVPL
jgi:hypothetical protein